MVQSNRSLRIGRSIRIFVVSMLAAVGMVRAGEQPDLAAQVRFVNEQIAAYHGSDPRVSERKLRFLYFVPSDRTPAADYRQRLTRVMEETSGFFESEFKRLGLRSQRLPLDRDADGLLKFIVVNGKEPWTAYNTKEQASAEKVREECRPALRKAGLNPAAETIALFSTIMEWDDSTRRFRQKAPYRGSGGPRQGFCWQIDAPPLDSLNLPAKSPKVDDGEFGMISLGDWNSKFVGGVIHELGHALGLAHNQERPEELKTLGTALMGTGNWTYGRERRDEGLGTFLTTADLFRLASHPFFTGSMKGLGADEKSSGGFQDLSVEVSGSTLLVKGRVSSSPSTYAVIAYCDPAGRSDYDALTVTTIPDATSGRFELRCDGLPKGKAYELRLNGLMVNGTSFGRSRLAFEVSNEGVIQAEELRSTLVLDPVLSALRQGESGLARKLVERMPETEPARALAAPMLTPPARRAAKADANAKTVSLCDLKPEKAGVGWRMPAYDYSPEDLFVRLDGRLQPRAIYAHAPSSYTWKLDGSWQRFQATCAIGNGYDGSVQFVVKTDGVERWRSGLVRGGVQKACDLELMNAKSLELSVEDGGDGMHHDHAFWFAPVLKRP